MRKIVARLCAVAVVAAAIGAEVTELKRYPLDNLEGVIAKSGVRLDQVVSSDGAGSLRVTGAPATVLLFETGDVDVENARLIYQARLRIEKLEGKAYLEMWCRFPGKGEFFSRGLHHAISGTTGWVSVETYFSLKKGENPDNVKLNLVVDGAGTAWIDDIRLLKGPKP
jgi:hypothetical protein